MGKCNLMKLICFFSILTLIVTMGFTIMAADDYTYESEFAKLPDEVKTMENIRFIDDHDEDVVQSNLANNEHEAHPYGNAWFTGQSGASLTYEFEGTTIGFLCQKGAFEIYIDDEYVDTVWKAYNGETQLAYFNDSLENDIHVITVVTDATIASQETPENYSVFHGFIVQDVVEPLPTIKPTEAPTEAPATVAPTAAPATVAPTVAPTAAPTTAPTEVPDDTSSESNDKTLIIVFIVLGALVVCAGVALVVLKKKKK